MTEKPRGTWDYILRYYGLPTFFCLILAMGMGQAVIWLGTHVAEPLIASHVQFLQKALEISTQQEKVLERLNITIAEHCKFVADNHVKLLEDDKRIMELLIEEAKDRKQQSELMKRLVECVEANKRSSVNPPAKGE